MQTDPGFIEYLLSGQYLPAVGIALITIVSLARTGLAIRWPWFNTKLGGYVLGFGSAATLYIATGLISGHGVDVGLVSNALAAGWAASGGWEMVRDILTALRKPPATSAPKMTVVGLAFVVALLGCSACKDMPTPEAAAAAVIDCVKVDAGDIDNALKEMVPIAYGEKPDWNAIENIAIAKGITVGGCALANLVQLYLGGRKAPRQAEGWAAHSALEHFRSTVAGGATFRTAQGDL